jgi:hypothetical protein
MAWSQFLGLQQTRFPELRSRSLVNSARFDKNRRHGRSFRGDLEFDGHRYLSLAHFHCESGFDTRANPFKAGVPPRSPGVSRAGWQGPPNAISWPLMATEGFPPAQIELCIAPRTYADTFENFESRAFPQGFLNHLETPAP